MDSNIDSLVENMVYVMVNGVWYAYQTGKLVARVIIKLLPNTPKNTPDSDIADEEFVMVPELCELKKMHQKRRPGIP